MAELATFLASFLTEELNFYAQRHLVLTTLRLSLFLACLMIFPSTVFPALAVGVAVSRPRLCPRYILHFIYSIAFPDLPIRPHTRGAFYPYS